MRSQVEMGQGVKEQRLSHATLVSFFHLAQAQLHPAPMEVQKQ